MSPESRLSTSKIGLETVRWSSGEEARSSSATLAWVAAAEMASLVLF